jgi:hypothetical protein
MSLQQFNATYMPVEDRILMRVTLTSREEFRFWLTRICLRGFFQQVETWLAPQDELPQSAIAAFQREAGVAKADFATPLTPGENLPLGEMPVLVQSIKIDVRGEPVHLVMALPDSRQADFAISGDVLVGIQYMLKQAVQAADWGLSTNVAVASGATARLH